MAERSDDLYWQNEEHADLISRTHGRAGPDNVEQSYAKMLTSYCAFILLVGYGGYRAVPQETRSVLVGAYMFSGF